ncbi:galactose-3-O-sulfotransferase 3-like [Watersipora subatra]|uniref:galactose-3-O-sulfotransferase 3-like n=1 Tax=Watersipora subatra TaxID=2589382 RepID=UPI00355ADD96
MARITSWRKCYIGIAALIFGLLASYYSYQSSTYRKVKLNLNVIDLSKPGNFVTPKTTVHHFAMTKVSKTGSTTMFGVLARRIIQYKLNLVIPKSGAFLFWNRPNSWKIGPRSGRAEALIHHSLYNKTMMDEVLEPDYKYIALAREPVSWFLSAINYYTPYLRKKKLLGHNLSLHQTPSADYVVTNKNLLYAPKSFGNAQTYFHLVQLQFTGFDYREKDNLSAINQHIASYISNVDVIILTEVYDASLLILKKRFSWSYQDIFYTKLVVGKPKHGPPISEKNRKTLLSPEVNLGDKLLYDRLNETWWKQPELEDYYFWDEVAYFSQINLNLTKVWCPQALKSYNPVTIPESYWHEELTLSLRFCKLLIRFSSKKYKRLREYAFTKR